MAVSGAAVKQKVGQSVSHRGTRVHQQLLPDIHRHLPPGKHKVTKEVKGGDDCH
jgi:hypothetical protein